ncbi:hypothetical protein [Moorena sp. SIO3I6]|nr:hypothetical protein [Moorena sp. SIO3I6]
MSWLKYFCFREQGIGSRESGIGNRELGIGSGATRGEFNYGSNAP